MRKFIVNKLIKKGYSANSANYYGNKIYNEWFGKNSNKYTFKEKFWAYKHGYLAELVRILNLDETNYKDYINSQDYYLLDPIDPVTKRLVDGKLTILYTIGGKFPQYLPKYYCWINEHGNVIKLEDNPVTENLDLENHLKKLLDYVGIVAIKPLAGSGGIGFLKLEKRDSKYYANNELLTDFSSIINLINDKYVVTEYINQCDEFNEVWPDSAATLRVICNNTLDGKNNVFVSYVRFGTKISKGACNLTSGGVAVPFDWETGKMESKFYRYAEFAKDNQPLTDVHPDSNYSFKDRYIPKFDEVKKLVNDISGYLSVHKYFGFDIIIANDKVIICEINSHPSMDYEQFMFGGIWKRGGETTRFFKDALDYKKSLLNRK